MAYHVMPVSFLLIARRTDYLNLPNQRIHKGLRSSSQAPAARRILPGMIASHTHLPVLGVPVESKSLASDGFFIIHRSDAGRCASWHAGNRCGWRKKNAALFAAQILSLSDEAIRQKLIEWRASQTDNVAEIPS